MTVREVLSRSPAPAWRLTSPLAGAPPLHCARWSPGSPCCSKADAPRQPPLSAPYLSCFLLCVLPSAPQAASPAPKSRLSVFPPETMPPAAPRPESWSVSIRSRAPNRTQKGVGFWYALQDSTDKQTAAPETRCLCHWPRTPIPSASTSKPPSPTTDTCADHAPGTRVRGVSPSRPAQWARSGRLPAPPTHPLI